MVRRSYPASRRCAAKEWLRVWQVACLAIAGGCGLDDSLEE
jgi:hypothetical protein